ncbi:MAG: ATP-binding protein, partial [Elusimicrobiota bacterium]
LGAPGVSVRWDRQALSTLPAVPADPDLVRDVLCSLIENAVKFNPAARKEAVLDARREGDSVRVTVSDNGPGIPPEEQPKLFRKFYQIDPDFTGQVRGMGLGLAFVKNVVEAHGGSAGLRSELGKGSEFFFTLPV